MVAFQELCRLPMRPTPVPLSLSFAGFPFFLPLGACPFPRLSLTEASKAMSAVMGLKNQFLENQLVAKELDDVPDGTAVYKLVGPVLLSEELDESRTNVRTRLSKITEQLQAGNNRVHAIETEMEQKRASLVAFQTELQKQEMGQMQTM